MKTCIILTASLLAVMGTALAGTETVADPAPTSGLNITPETRNECESKSPFAIARDGKALAPIIISEKAGPATKQAAEELRNDLSRISGADFKIETGNGETGIVLGTIAEFPVPALTKALEIRHGMDGKEAYAIRSREKSVLLLGATDLAAGHAAYRLLEELGCRWFFPNPTDTWEVIPKIADLTIRKDVTDRPTFLERRIWYAWGIFNDDGHPAQTPDRPRNAGSDYADWSRRNHMAGSFVTNTGHAYEGIAREKAAEFEAHPEYWALVDGKRQGPQFELGNPALRRLVIDWAIKQIKDNPSLDMVSVDPADGYGLSQSEESKAYGQGSAADASFMLANDVARALQNEFPGENKMVGMYAYNWHSDPPPFALEPNVYIQLTTSFNAGRLTFDELLEQWPKNARNLGFYDYYSTWLWDHDMWPGGRVADANYVTGMIRRFQGANLKSGAYATSISAESSNNWGVNGRGYYLASRLMWNPDLDAESVLDDFYEHAFGPAAAAMKKFYGYQDTSPPMSPGVVGALFRTMKAARDAARGDAVVMRRLDDLTNSLHYVDLNYRNDHAGDGKNAERDREIAALMYRNRYSYMNHWEAFRQNVIAEDRNPTAAKPWKVDRPITRDETEAWLQSALQYYPELHIPDTVRFSKELVAVAFPDAPAPTETSQLYQEGSRYLVWSRNGEPISIKIEAGNAYGLNKHAYSITDLKGKVFKQGKPELGTTVEFDWKPPAPGVYVFDYNDAGAYGRVFWKADQVVSLPTDARHFRAMEHAADMYFYVPKGTKEINYYYKRADWQFGGPHQVTAPDGKVVREVNVDGDYISVPVEAGMDGKIWKVGGPSFGLGDFRFFNVPNFFSPNRNIMLLPKDVAQQDDLEILGGN